MRSSLLPLRRLVLLASASLALLAAAAPAGAAKAVPCWKLVLQDSYSGHFDTIYKHSCYTQAMSRIPATLRIYSDTHDEIQAASNAALNNKTYLAREVAGGDTGTAASSSTSGGSKGVPTAIVVLGGVAVALLLVGGAGEAWRRTHRKP